MSYIHVVRSGQIRLSRAERLDDGTAKQEKGHITTGSKFKRTGRTQLTQVSVVGRGSCIGLEEILQGVSRLAGDTTRGSTSAGECHQFTAECDSRMTELVLVPAEPIRAYLVQRYEAAQTMRRILGRSVGFHSERVEQVAPLLPAACIICIIAGIATGLFIAHMSSIW